MGQVKETKAAEHRSVGEPLEETKPVSSVEQLPTRNPALAEVSTQVSTTVPMGFAMMFDEVVSLVGLSRSEAIRQGMHLIMRQCGKDAKVYAYILAKLEQRKQAGKRP